MLVRVLCCDLVTERPKWLSKCCVDDGDGRRTTIDSDGQPTPFSPGEHIPHTTTDQMDHLQPDRIDIVGRLRERGVRVDLVLMMSSKWPC